MMSNGIHLSVVPKIMLAIHKRKFTQQVLFPINETKRGLDCYASQNYVAIVLLSFSFRKFCTITSPIVASPLSFLRAHL